MSVGSGDCFGDRSIVWLDRGLVGLVDGRTFLDRSVCTVLHLTVTMLYTLYGACTTSSSCECLLFLAFVLGACFSVDEKLVHDTDLDVHYGIRGGDEDDEAGKEEGI